MAIDNLSSLTPNKQDYPEIAPPPRPDYYLSAEEYNKLLRTLQLFIDDYNMNVGSMSQGLNLPLITSSDSITTPTDSNLFTAARTLREITEVLNQYNQMYLSKVHEDKAEEKITFNKGIEFGDYQNGFKGGIIDQNGDGELKSLRLREWLEVPEFRFNRVKVEMGDKWRAPGGGIIESVDFATQTAKLKLEPGEYGAIEVDDLCMGIFHSVIADNNSNTDTDDSRNNRTIKGFATSYFKIVELLDPVYNSEFRFELRPLSARYSKQVAPEEFMNFAVFGNPTNVNRQSSAYETRTYQRFLINMTDWESTQFNVAAQFGDLSNLNNLGLTGLTGYSIYLDNVYLSGTIQQVKTPRINPLTNTWEVWNGTEWVNSWVPASGVPKDGLYHTMMNPTIGIARENPIYTHSWAELHIFEGDKELTYVSTPPLTVNGTYVVSLTASGVTPGDLSLTTINNKTFVRTTPIEGMNEAAENGSIVFNITGLRVDGTTFNYSANQTFNKIDSGTDGKDIEYIYTRTTSNVAPPAPSSSVNTDNYVPTEEGWTGDSVGVDNIYKYEWYAKRIKINGAWGKWNQKVSQWRYYVANGVDGKDGSTREYIYIANNDAGFTIDANRPSMIVQRDDFVPKPTSNPSWSVEWFDEPQNPDGTQQYEWYCFRDRTGGSGSGKVPGTWGAFNGPYMWSRYGKDGVGTSAPLLYLSANSPIIAFDINDNLYPNQNIIFEAKLQNITGTVNFTAIAYTSSGTEIGEITLLESNNTATIEQDTWLANYHKVVVTATLETLTDKVTVYKLKDAPAGQGAITGLLTNESITLPASNVGTVPQEAYNKLGKGEFWIYDGRTRVYNGVKYSVVTADTLYCTVNINVNTGLYTITALDEDYGIATLRAEYDGVTTDKVLTLAKSKKGDIGLTGPPGTGVPIVYRGEYKDTSEYYGSTTRLDIVRYIDGNYYRTRETTNKITGIVPKNLESGVISDKWYDFGASFDSVATELLLAENANIAGFVYKDLVMQSQMGISSTGAIIDLAELSPIPTVLDFIPNLKIDGVKGSLSLRDKIKLFGDGSGYLANNNLRWDNSGNLLIGPSPAGKDGDTSGALYTEFSITGEGNWHTDFVVGDIYMRNKVDNGIWSLPKKIVGEVSSTKSYKEYQFANNNSDTTAPLTDSTDWVDSPAVPTVDKPHMWMRYRVVTHNDIPPDTYGPWSTPSRITGLNGYTSGGTISTIQFNINGSGHLANNNISWDTLGNLTIKGQLFTGTKGSEFYTNEIRTDGSGRLGGGKIKWESNNSGYIGNGLASGITWDTQGNVSIGGLKIVGAGLTNDAFTDESQSPYIILRDDSHNIFAGIGANVLPSDTGLRAVARFVNNESNQTWGSTNYTLVVEASGALKNIAINMSSGMLSGLAVMTRQITSTTQLNHSDVYISAYNTTDITISLPINPELGKVIIVKRMNTANITFKGRQITGINELIDWGLATGLSKTAFGEKGDTHVFIWDKQYWNYSFIGRGS